MSSWEKISIAVFWRLSSAAHVGAMEPRDQQEASLHSPQVYRVLTYHMKAVAKLCECDALLLTLSSEKSLERLTRFMMTKHAYVGYWEDLGFKLAYLKKMRKKLLNPKNGIITEEEKLFAIF